MKTPRRPKGSWIYVSKSDQKLPVAEQTQFVCRPLTQAERMEAADNGAYTTRGPNGQRTMVPRAFQLARELCLSNVLDVVNLQVPDGDGYKILPFPKDGTVKDKSDFWEVVDDLEVLYIGQDLLERSDTEPEIKNSLPPALT